MLGQAAVDPRGTGPGRRAPEPSVSRVIASASGPARRRRTWPAGEIPSSRIPTAGSNPTIRARYAFWFQISGPWVSSAATKSSRSAGRIDRPLRLRPRTASGRRARRGSARCSGRHGRPRSWPGCRASGGPCDPWPIVPAKKIPGTEALSQYGGLGRQPALAERRHARAPGGRAAASTNPVAAITSSASKAAAGPPLDGRVRTMKPDPPGPRSIASIEASRIPTPPPSTWSS